MRHREKAAQRSCEDAGRPVPLAVATGAVVFAPGMRSEISYASCLGVQVPRHSYLLGPRAPTGPARPLTPSVVVGI